jgi:PAS domain-containing protein
VPSRIDEWKANSDRGTAPQYRKDKMNERKQLIQKTLSIEQLLTSIIEHSNEIYYLHDIHHKFIYVSPQSLQILGYTPDEMMIEWTKLVTDNPINTAGYEITEKAIKTGQRAESVPFRAL